MKAKRLEKLLPLLGAVLLFISWAVQQFLFTEWNSALSRIGSSEAIFHTYRANNGVFLTLRSLNPSDKTTQIETYQLDNYKRGLSELAESVGVATYEKFKADSMATLATPTQFENLETDFKIMVEFGAIQRALNAQKVDLSLRKETAERWFLALYIFGTVLVIAGGIAKLIADRAELAQDKAQAVHIV